MKIKTPNIDSKKEKEEKKKKGGFFASLRGGAAGDSGGFMGSANSVGSRLAGSAASGAAGAGTEAAGGLLGKAFLGKLLGSLLVAALIGFPAIKYFAGKTPGANELAKRQQAIEASAAANANYKSAMEKALESQQGKNTMPVLTGITLDEDEAARQAEKVDNGAAGEAAEPGVDYNADSGVDMQEMANGAESSKGIVNSKLSTSFGGSNNGSGFGSFTSESNFSQAGGFKKLPQLSERSQKLSAMNKLKKAAYKAGARKNIGSKSGALAQLKQTAAIQKSYTGKSADTAVATQSTAWSGTTSGGSADGGEGAGLGEGSGVGLGGVVTSPSIDNVSSDVGTSYSDDVADVGDATDATPWASQLQTVMMLLTGALVLIGLAAAIVKMENFSGMFAFLNFPPAIMAAAMLGIATIMAGIATVMALSLGSQYGQTKLAAVYGSIAGLVTAASAIGTAAAWAAAPSGSGSVLGVAVTTAKVSTLCAWTAGIGMLATLLGGMMAG